MYWGITREPSAVNYNLNTFVISTGEYLAALTHGAPWMNSQPINHGQAYMLLSALHEELFNEIFPWANIDNTVQQAIATVYQGYQPLVQGKPKLFRYVHGEYAMVTEQSIKNVLPIHDLPPGKSLPTAGSTSHAYRVHGGKTYADYLSGFISNTLTHIRWSLHNELNKYLGTSRNYEWYFEYTANGIVYTRQQEAVINYVQPEMPQTEQDLINQEISLMAKSNMGTVPRLVIDTTGYENNNWDLLIHQLPNMVTTLYHNAMHAGVMDAEIAIHYRNPRYMRDLMLAINHHLLRVPVRFNIVPVQQESAADVMQAATDSLNRNLSNRSIQVMNDQQNQLADQLLDVRNRIVKRNNVTELDMKELTCLAPEVLNHGIPQNDLSELMSNRDLWYKLNGANPERLCFPVVTLAIAISNHVDVLNGNAPSNVSIPIFKPTAEEQPISVIPLYCK